MDIGYRSNEKSTRQIFPYMIQSRQLDYSAFGRRNSMPRARNIKPGFFKNEVLGGLPFEDRLTFVGLWTLADREGRLEDRPSRIRIEIFPFDPKVNVNSCLDRLHAAGLVRRYHADGGEYLFIPMFKKHQRPHANEAESEIPPYSFQQDTQKNLLPKSERLLPRSQALATKVESACYQNPSTCDHGDKRFALNPERGILNPDTERPPADRFAEFWDLYPRKDGKAAAEKVFRSQATNDAKADTIITALRKQLPGLKARDPQYRPHARTWLSQKRWQDEVEEPEPKGEEYEFDYHKPFDFDRIKPTGERGPDLPSLQELMDDFLEVAKEDVN